MYQGDYVADTRDGQGTYTFKNGNKYQGGYKLNKKHGFGIFIWDDKVGAGAGDRYEGEWINDVREGKGKYIWKSGNRY